MLTAPCLIIFIFWLRLWQRTVDWAGLSLSFKQETGFAYQKRFRRRLWQPRYYDHILRS